jgi:Lon protease-like protein
VTKQQRDDTPGDLGPALADLPVFPLPSVVLFPRALLPLHIFEPRYRAMLQHCLETHRAMAIAHIPDESDKDAKGQPRFATIAGVGAILEHQPLADGRSNILLYGRARVQLEELPSDTPWRRARATIVDDLPSSGARVSTADRAALVAAATAFAAELHKRDDFSFALPPNAKIGAVADLCAQHLVADAKVRQALLEERDIVERVRMVIAELALQHRALLGSGGSVLH